MAVPKNIKQMGELENGIHIYIEDYVYTYLHTVTSETDGGRKPAILVGKHQDDETTKNIYISGAISMEVMKFDNGRMIISEQTWSDVYSQCRNYFAYLDIIGWFYPTDAEISSEIEELERAHRVYFPGQDKVLYVNQFEEKDDYFYRVENGVFHPQKGYCIYYEKNPQMQEYMVNQKASQRIVMDRQDVMQPEEPEDRAVVRYREIVADQIRKDERHEKFRNVALGMVTVAFIGVFSYFMWVSYGKVDNLEQLVDKMESTLGVTENQDGEVVANTTPEDTNDQENNSNQDNNGDQEDSDAAKTDSEVTDQNSDQNTDEDTTKEDTTNEDTTNEDTTTQEDTTAVNSYLQQGYYMVQKGDSLEGICRKVYGNTKKMDAICKKNNIDNKDEIYAGQKLLLP